MAISPITQTISTIPTAGHRGIDVQNVFVTKQEAFQDALTGTFVGQINTVKDQINTVVVGINNSITEIEDSVSEAKQSEDKAKVSEDNAKQSENKAKVSELNAKQSELNAQAYAGVINPETFVNSKFSIGFIDHTTSTLTCVGDIVRLTFTQDTNIYKYAVPYEFTQGTILEINTSTHTKGFWIILNELTKALEIKTTTPDFDSDILVSWIYRNATDGIIWRNEERHLCSRNVEWHKSHHLETGAVLISGGNINYTLNDPSSLALGINTPIKIADEELFFDITHSNAPTGYFDQVLNSNALIPILYLDNNLEYKSVTRTDPSCLYLYNGTRAVYNDTTLGTLVTAPNNSYICYWLLYTTDYLVPIKLVLGIQAHTNISDAELEAFENLGLNMPEVIGVSKIILYINDTYTQNPAKAVLHSVYYLIKNENVLNPSFIPSNHNSLIGRNEDNQHPISAITGLEDTLENKLDKITTNITVTVGSGGQFSTINQALEYLTKIYPTYKSSGVTATINLLAGFVMAEQVLVRGLNLGWITITGADAETNITHTALTTSFNGTNYPVFGVDKGGTSPVIGQLFRFNIEKVGGAKHGLMAFGAGSSANVLYDKGFIGAGAHGIYALNGSTINANSANCSNAGSSGIYALNGSTINANSANCSNAGAHGIASSTASTINANSANCSNAVGYGIVAVDASTINANSANCSNAGSSGIASSNASTINVNSAIIQNQTTGTARVVVDTGSHIEAAGINTTGGTSPVLNQTANVLTANGIIYQ